MKSHLNHIVENCGNFSSKVLPGLITYGRESDKPNMKGNPNPNLPTGDGYATREHDIKLGGFIFRACAREASRQGQNLFHLSVEEKQRLALRTCKEHLRLCGETGLENYKHWLKRVHGFAKYHQIQLPSKGSKESTYEYSRRLRKWTAARQEKWPKPQKAAGTHLVFSPDPKIWFELRRTGIDERIFLRESLTKTMKEFQDWRSNSCGRNHAIGWIAGTHVLHNGADRHPHIHVVVLKKDEAGKTVDWSVSTLKGKGAGTQEPDPIRTVKQLFQKVVEKEYARCIGKTVEQLKTEARQPAPQIQVGNTYLVRRLQALANIAFPNGRPHPQSELGALLRLVALYRNHRLQGKEYVEQNLPTLVGFKKWIDKQYPKTKTQSLQPGD